MCSSDLDDKGRYLSPNDILVLLYYYLTRYRHERGPVVRNLCTTHMLDRIAEKFGENCYEVPVGFKHISAKITETDALIGGESSGGLTVRGHINGKDGVYAAALLVEMLAVTGRRISEIYDDIGNEFGRLYMVALSDTISSLRDLTAFISLALLSASPSIWLPSPFFLTRVRSYCLRMEAM